MLNLILFGPPGAGKGTQSEHISTKYELVHLSTGDILRAEIKNQSELGIKAKQYIDQGLLVPDEVVIGMIDLKIDQNNQAKGFLFDGFPRTIPQAKALDALLESKKSSISQVISLEVDEEELVKRLKGRASVSGRSDDADEGVIRKRIDVYKNETFPLKDFYNTQGKVKTVKGVGNIEEIFSEICTQINQN